MDVRELALWERRSAIKKLEERREALIASSFVNASESGMFEELTKLRYEIAELEEESDQDQEN